MRQKQMKTRELSTSDLANEWTIKLLTGFGLLNHDISAIFCIFDAQEEQVYVEGQ